MLPINPIAIELPDELCGSRVRVRPYQAKDADAVWEAIQESRDHLSPWMPWTGDYQSLLDAQIYVRRAQASWLSRQDLAVGVFAVEDGRFLGGAGLHRVDWNMRRFEIGYWLRHTAEGHGYMREAVQLLTRLAFEELGANRVEIRMNPLNVRSRKVAERLGLVLEGTLRRSGPSINGRPPCDSHVFALVPEDYARLDWSRNLP